MTDLNEGATVTDGGGLRTFITPSDANDFASPGFPDYGHSTYLQAYFAISPDHKTAIIKTDLGSAKSVGAMTTYDSVQPIPWTSVEYAASPSGPWTAVTGLATSYSAGSGPLGTGVYTMTFDSQSARYWRLVWDYMAPSGYQPQRSLNHWAITAGAPPGPPPPPSGPVVTINGVTFDNPKEVIIRAELNAAGEGHITLDRNDPQATAANLVRGSICYVNVPEIDPDLPVFAFILENGDWDVISSDEEGGEELRFGGPGVLWLLHRAVIAPEEYETGTGYPKPLKGIWVFADGVTEGHILNKLLREAESVSRPQQPLAGVSDDFTSVLDSDGVSWGAEVLDGKWKVPIGAYLYDEVLRLVAAGLIQVEMDPSAGPGEDLVLHAWRTIGTDRTGDFGAGVVRFEKGVNIADELVKSMAGRDFVSHAYVRYGEDGGDYTNTAKNGTWPYVQEGYIEANTSAATTARRIAKGQMGWREAAQDAPAFAHIVPWPGSGNDEANGIYLPGPRWTANGLYWVGDLVTLHTGTGETDYNEQTFRVYAVTLQMDETGYLAPPIVELNSAYSGPSSPELRSVASMPGTGGLAGGTSSGGGTGGSGGGSSGGLVGGTYQPIAEKGQADGYAGLDGSALVPYDQLGTGGDGSGDNVLHDDGTWGAAGGVIPAHTYELANEGGDPLLQAHGSFGTTETIDPTDGNVHTGTLDADCTVTLSAPTGSSGTLLLWLTQDGTGGRDITFAGSVAEIGTPDTTAGVTNLAVATTVDAGTTWVVAWIGTGPVVAALDDLTDVTITSATSGDALRYIGGAWVNANLHDEPMIATDGSVMVSGTLDPMMHEVAW